MANSFAAYAGVAKASFLTLPFALIANGAAAQASAGEFSWPRTLAALVGLLAAHAAVNVLNEVSDYETRIDFATVPTPFSGGSGTLPSGRLPVGKARAFGWALLAVCAAVAVLLVAQVGLALVPFVAIGLLFVVGYTPWMTRSATGELAAGLGLGLLPVLGAAVVQGGHVSATAVAAGVPAFFMTFNLLLLNEFPDEQADRDGGRCNLVLLLGRARAALLYVAMAALGVASIPIAVGFGLLPAWCLAAMLPAVALVPAVRWAFGSPATAVPMRAMGGNVVWNLATNGLLAAGFVVAALRG